jgi:hypothetical protein
VRRRYRSVTPRKVRPNWSYMHDCNQLRIGESCESRLRVSHHDYADSGVAPTDSTLCQGEGRDHRSTRRIPQRVRDRWLGKSPTRTTRRTRKSPRLATASKCRLGAVGARSTPCPDIDLAATAGTDAIAPTAAGNGAIANTVGRNASSELSRSQAVARAGEGGPACALNVFHTARRVGFLWPGYGTLVSPPCSWGLVVLALGHSGVHTRLCSGSGHLRICPTRCPNQTEPFAKRSSCVHGGESDRPGVAHPGVHGS